jgi:hypothetical protein
MASLRLSVCLSLALSVGACNCGGPPIINSFTATPATLPVDGGTTSLAWDVVGAKTLSIDQGVGDVSPETTGSQSVNLGSTATFTLTATNSSGSVTQPVTVCVDQPVTFAVTTPSVYVCDAGYHAAFSLTNGSCGDVTVTSIQLSAVASGGGCAPPSPGSYSPSVKTVPAGETLQVFNLEAGPFCCTNVACPPNYTCDQQYTFLADTSAGTLDAGAAVMLDLSNCDIICP